MAWKRLHLDGNGFTGPVPPNIYRKDMEELMLHNNKLTGTYPANEYANTFDGTSKLTTVTTYGNELNGDMHKICHPRHGGKMPEVMVDDGSTPDPINMCL
jgi:hypothetical protein